MVLYKEDLISRPSSKFNLIIWLENHEKIWQEKTSLPRVNFVVFLFSGGRCRTLPTDFETSSGICSSDKKSEMLFFRWSACLAAAVSALC